MKNHTTTKNPNDIAHDAPQASEAKLREEIVADVLEALRRGALDPNDSGILEAIPERPPTQVPVIPFPIPWRIQATGLYEWSFPPPQPIPQPIPIPRPEPPQPERTHSAVNEEAADSPSAPTPIFFLREELRLDIDGRYPQMVASGTLFAGLATQVHWIANLVSSGINTYTGSIWYEDGNTGSFPYTNVSIQVVKSLVANQRKATVTFTGGGALKRVRTYGWKSGYIHPAEFEYDTVAGASAVTSINTGAHPNRPPSLPTEDLSIEAVYRRAGFDVVTSGGNNVIPLGVAGPDGLWSDMEMHDAMQAYWSRFADKPQWSLWMLFAGQHVAVPSQGITPENLGGIMFDDIGPSHRQGAAVFDGSFINTAHPGDPSPSAAVQRMKFWTACHEMGHTFNLAHSWQKSHPPSWGTPWIPLVNEPEARSFMNYPYNVVGGQSAFFADFDYRFSDAELLFMRHAPLRFVQQGNADWFDNHGFQQANVSPTPSLSLELRVHRTLDYFDFLEPVVAELKLTNTTQQPLIVDETILSDTDSMTVIVKKQGKSARQWSPYARYCCNGNKKVLAARESMYGSLFVTAGLNGFDLAEPGLYSVQVALHRENEDILSNTLRVRVAPPRTYDEEFVAQDFFSEDVGRTLAFNGTRTLHSANGTLREVAERWSDRRVAKHARLALGNPLACIYKLLVVDDQQASAGSVAGEKRIAVLEREPEAAREQLSQALVNEPTQAADTLGHIGYAQMVVRYAEFLAEGGEPKGAAEGLAKAEKELAARGVLDSVVNDLAGRAKAYAGQTASKGAKRTGKK